ncbi:hypothetical protein [Undibacterium squillarum]|uniref:hypothetical protein n=1 Tax=Undibacterium squillarum TaxID=1131567 RepID=UPI0035ADAC69
MDLADSATNFTLAHLPALRLRLTTSTALRLPPAPENGIFSLKCGVQHSDPAVVGRKSGSPQMADDDFCRAKLAFPSVQKVYDVLM